jgi:ATP/maltotriose-dependent transcriptional regulator MalT/DNA-binding SARP family transcriptional activator
MIGGITAAGAAARIARPRLTERIGSALEHGNLVLVADPGFGKTWATEEALHKLGLDAAWVRCVPEDREPARFLRDAAQAVSVARPELADDPPASIRALLDRLDRVLVEPFVLAVDDTERIADSPGALALLDELLRSDVQRVRVVVLSRVELPLKLAKLRAAGALTEIRRGELGFSAAECREVLALRAGADPDADRVAAVMEATEGWPLGVALQSLTGVPAKGRVTAEVASFLVEEALDQLEPEFATWLLVAGLPRELDAAAAAALELPPGFAETAERRGLFVRALDPQRTRFAFHPLFREVLAELLPRSVDPERVRELRRALAPAVMEHDPAEAIEHLIAAEAWDDAVAALGVHGADLARTSPDLVASWIDAMPDATRSEPEILMLHGTVEYGRGRLEQAIEPLLAARDEFARRGDVPRRWLTALNAAGPLFTTGRFDEMVAQAEGFDAPEAAPAGMLAYGTAHHAATAIAGLGRRRESEELAERIFALPGSEPVRLYDAMRRAYAEIPGGAVDDVLAHAQSVAAQFDEHDELNIGTINVAGIAQMLQEVGRDAEAADWWRRAAERAQRNGMLPYIVTFAHLHLALMRALEGKAAEAEAEVALAGPVVGAGWRVHILHCVHAVLAARRGDVPAALTEAERCVDIAAGGPINEQVWSAEALGEALADAGEQDHALRIVDRALATCDKYIPGDAGRFYRARLLLVRAHARGSMDDVGEAWEAAGPAVEHMVRRHRRIAEQLLPDAIERGVVPAAEALAVVDRALPGGEALTAFLDSSDPETRAASIGPAAASGHPTALERLRDLEEDPDEAVRAAARRATERLAQSPPTLSFRVLGRFSARRGQWEIGEADWGRPMVARLVRFLLVNRDQGVPEDELFEAFWPGRSAEAARRSLQVTVSAARSVLDVPGAATVLETGSRMYRLNLPATARVDADDFQRLAAAALGEPPGPRRRAALERAVAAWSGEPLPEERYAAWALVYRERLLDTHRHLLRELLDACSEAGDPPGAIAAARSLVLLDVLDEGARRELIRAYARAGRRADALREFMELRRALVDELGVEPDAETAALHARVLAGEPV